MGIMAETAAKEAAAVQVEMAQPAETETTKARPEAMVVTVVMVVSVAMVAAELAGLVCASTEILRAAIRRSAPRR